MDRTFTMIGFGMYFLKTAPKEINAVFGYRTAMSMKNKETWKFAHKYCGKIWCISGLVCFVQLIPLIGSIIPTERALKRNFDENGNRK